MFCAGAAPGIPHGDRWASTVCSSVVSEDGTGGGEPMKIGLIDVDGHNFPNLALMKLSAWHKAQGGTKEVV